MTNRISLDANNVGSFLGPIASRYSYTPSLRAVLDGIYQAAQRSENRYFVLDGETVKAAQSTLIGAQNYMRDGFVLVDVEVLMPSAEDALKGVLYAVQSVMDDLAFHVQTRRFRPSNSTVEKLSILRDRFNTAKHLVFPSESHHA